LSTPNDQLESNKIEKDQGEIARSVLLMKPTRNGPVSWTGERERRSGGRKKDGGWETQGCPKEKKNEEQVATEKTPRIPMSGLKEKESYDDTEK